MPIERQRKRASVYTLGCRLNQAESALIEERLVEAGYEIVPFGAPAELGVIHTCTVTQEADAKSRKMARQFIRRNPGAFTAVIGCYAERNAEALAAIKGVDLILGNRQKLDLPAYIEAGKATKPRIVCDRIQKGDFTIPVAHGRMVVTRRSNLKIQDGCNFMCSFCVIPFVRGRERSRTIENLVEEAEALVARGAKEIVLTGVNLGAYECSGRGLADVADRLNAIAGLCRIRISSIEPTTIPDGILERMRAPDHALTPHLHVPMQSGSDKILKAMRRMYTRDDYLAAVCRAAERVPGIGIGGDIMVGFPGETERDFEDTCALFEQSPLFYAHVVKYSERPGAAAARMAGKVDPRTAATRSARLHRLSEKKKRRFQERFLGTTVEVLFESPEDPFAGEPPDVHDTGAVLWGGYTGKYVRVAAYSGENLENQLRRVVLERIGGEIVYGRIV